MFNTNLLDTICETYLFKNRNDKDNHLVKIML